MTSPSRADTAGAAAYPSVRWASAMDSGKSAALRAELVERMRAGRRPVGWVAGTSDIGLRTERVDTIDHDAAQAFDIVSLRGRLVRNLSSGERQRLRLTEALAPGTRDIALDEPARHLDPGYVGALGTLLERRKREGASVLACDPRTQLPARLFDLEVGTRVEAGDLEPVAASPGSEAISVAVPLPFLLDAPASAAGGPRLELAVRRGELVSLGGPNGGGKTSLLEAMRRSAQRAGTEVGLARQDLEVHIFERSARLELEDVLGTWRPLPPSLQHHLGAASSVPELADALAVRIGLARWLDTPMSSLPLGALALLGTAVALVVGRELVLLDEPTQGLDLAASRLLAGFLAAHANVGARLVVATHDPEITRVANAHWRVEHGNLDTEVRA